MDYKKCSRCSRVLSVDKFGTHKKKGLQTWCKECRSEYDRQNYIKNRERIKKRNKKGKQLRIQINKDNLVDYLLKHPCVDCDETNIVILTFDHVRGKKEFTISDAVNQGTIWPRIEKEIKKCKVRCFNCHMKRTAKQQGWSKSKKRKKK